MNSVTTPPPAATAPESKKHNKLELPQQFRLLDWCRQNEDKVKTLSDSALAQIAEAELGFKITTPNLTSVRQGAGIEKLKPAAPPTVEERLTQLENLFAAHFPLCNPPQQPTPLPVSEFNRLEQAPKLATGLRHLATEFPTDTRDDHELYQPPAALPGLENTGREISTITAPKPPAEN
jgi:hypothetical protein